MKRLFGLIALILSNIIICSAQFVEPVSWSSSESKKGEELTLIFNAKIEKSWHMYGLQEYKDGPQNTEFTFETLDGVKLVGKPQLVSGKEIKHMDDVFEMELSYFEDAASFAQKLKITGEKYKISGYVTYMSCCDGSCTPPSNYEFTFEGDGIKTANAEKTSATSENSSPAGKDNSEVVLESSPSGEETSASYFDKSPSGEDSSEVTANTSSTDLWTPVIDQLNKYNAEGGNISDASGLIHSWWYILLAGFLAGLVALVTPCVWPMIPMTVSFFLKRTKDRKKSIRDAYTYGISIIVIYVGLGLIVTALFGASALNSLATNAIFNIIFFLLLVVLAISFLGAFEIKLPASWTSKLDEKADATTGLLSIFFMAFTLCLVSFSCTGPIIGTLLVEAATSGSMLYPAIGMFGFALALSLPFTLFAMFPSLLKAAPKSGGWLNMVKVVLGFCELALAFKFLSVADLAYGWGILDRETFLCFWIVIFAFLGMYLLGFIRLPHDDDPQPSDRVSVTRLSLALISFAFALYMVPGLWGAPCKAISAFAPPMSTQDFNLDPNSRTFTYHDYEEGMAVAARTGKPVLIDFSGYGCVNCRKMEAAVWTDSQVKSIIDNEYILVELMVDDKTALPNGTEIVTENGKEVKLRTIGDKWSYLQRSKFGANAQPFYVLLDAQGQPLAGSYSYNEDVNAYVNFLKSGLK